MSKSIALDVIQNAIQSRAVEEEATAREHLVRVVKQALVEYTDKSNRDWEEVNMVVGALAASSTIKWFNEVTASSNMEKHDWIRMCAENTVDERRHAIEERIAKEMMGNLLKRR